MATDKSVVPATCEKCGKPILECWCFAADDVFEDKKACRCDVPNAGLPIPITDKLKSEDSAALPSPQCAKLLELLVGLLLFEPFVRGSRTHQGNFQNWLAAAKAEIAKAKGETS